MIIESYINRGNSFPIIIRDNEKKYFVKLRAGMSGNYSLVNEWIGNKLGGQLGIKTQTPVWVELNSGIKTTSIHVEVKELVTKSIGLNIGFDYKKNAIEVKKQSLHSFDKKRLVDIFLFDLMMINIDRTSNNLNLMKVGNELFSVDYESSLLVQEIIENKNLLEDVRILQCLRNNPLYQKIKEDTIDEFIKKGEQLSINEILLEIPENLLSKKDGNSIIENFEERKSKGWYLKEVMYRLKNIKRETPAERKVRIQKNQAAFIRKFKENS